MRPRPPREPIGFLDKARSQYIEVDDLAAATAFFVELGLKLQGEGPG